jgi:hypothetical protein
LCTSHSRQMLGQRMSRGAFVNTIIMSNNNVEPALYSISSPMACGRLADMDMCSRLWTIELSQPWSRRPRSAVFPRAFSCSSSRTYRSLTTETRQTLLPSASSPILSFDRTDSFQAGCANGLTPVVGDTDYFRNALFEFDILERTFTDRHPFFELRGIAWNESRVEARESLTPSSTDDELLKAF